MAARPRARQRSNWPRGLREVRPGYYAWVPPADVAPLLDKKSPAGGFILGRIPLADAIAQVIETMLHALKKLNQPRLVHAVQGSPDTLADFVPQYLERVAARGVAKNTVVITRQRLNRIPDTMTSLRVELVTTRHVADYLASLSATPRTQQAVRSLLLDLFREAIAAGWRSDNPAAATRSERVTTQRGRLSLEAFKSIHAWSLANQPAWATRALELALVTAQRRGDVASMMFSQVQDGFLKVQQSKTGAKVAIPVGLHLSAMGWTVGDVIGRCRDAVVSRNIIHHSAHAGLAKPGDKVRAMSIGQMFAKARDSSGVTVSGKEGWPGTVRNPRKSDATL